MTVCYLVDISVKLLHADIVSKLSVVVKPCSVLTRQTHEEKYS